MGIGLVFWIIFLICIILGVGRMLPAYSSNTYVANGGNLVVLVLLFLLGWKVFGFIIQG